MSLCMILIHCAGLRSVSLPAGRQHRPFPKSVCAWLHWLGVTTQVRGQFGASSGSSMLSNIPAGPLDWIRSVSWKQAYPPPTLNHESTQPMVGETARLHSLFISFTSSAPITWLRWINLNNRNKGSLKRPPLSRRAIKPSVQFVPLFLSENSLNGYSFDGVLHRSEKQNPTFVFSSTCCLETLYLQKLRFEKGKWCLKMYFFNLCFCSLLLYFVINNWLSVSLMLSHCIVGRNVLKVDQRNIFMMCFQATEVIILKYHVSWYLMMSRITKWFEMKRSQLFQDYMLRWIQ